jgi:hypothetical protein
LTDFRNLLLGMSLALSPLALCAQSGTYSGSPEYQKMMEELGAPSPSLAYIATGQRQLPDPALPVHVHDKRELLQLRTKAIEITVDKSRATLTVVNLLTNANWIFSFAPTPPAQPVSIQRQQNTWSIATPGAGTIQVEFLHASLVRLTWTGPEPLTVLRSRCIQKEPPRFSAWESDSSRQDLPTPTSTCGRPTSQASLGTIGSTWPYRWSTRPRV